MTDQKINGVIVHAYERLDDLCRNGYRLIQDPARFCFGQDAVLLSAFARVHAGERTLDLGTGTGVIPILLSAKTMGAYFCGLEIQPESIEMAKRSVALNGLTDKIAIIEGDLRNPTAFAPASFDVVTANPPYIPANAGLLNGHPSVAAARHELLCTLTDVVAAAARALRPMGRFYMVHRPYRLADLFAALRAARLEPKTIRMVHPAADKEPCSVLLESTRGGRAALRVLPPLIIHDAQGRYTEETRRIYETY